MYSHRLKLEIFFRSPSGGCIVTPHKVRTGSRASEPGCQINPDHQGIVDCFKLKLSITSPASCVEPDESFTRRQYPPSCARKRGTTLPRACFYAGALRAGGRTAPALYGRHLSDQLATHSGRGPEETHVAIWVSGRVSLGLFHPRAGMSLVREGAKAAASLYGTYSSHCPPQTLAREPHRIPQRECGLALTLGCRTSKWKTNLAARPPRPKGYRNAALEAFSALLPPSHEQQSAATHYWYERLCFKKGGLSLRHSCHRARLPSSVILPQCSREPVSAFLHGAQCTWRGSELRKRPAAVEETKSE